MVVCVVTVARTDDRQQAMRRIPDIISLELLSFVPTDKIPFPVRNMLLQSVTILGAVLKGIHN